MGLSWYNAWDLVTTSEAEGKRNKYRSAVNSLDSKIAAINENIANASSNFQDLHNYFQGNGGLNKGYFNSRFLEKENEHRDSVLVLMSAFQNARDQLGERRTAAESKRSYWQGICDQEDKDQKEYSSK
jgi:hypothetical protein